MGEDIRAFIGFDKNCRGLVADGFAPLRFGVALAVAFSVLFLASQAHAWAWSQQAAGPGRLAAQEDGRVTVTSGMMPLTVTVSDRGDVGQGNALAVDEICTGPRI